MTASAPTDPRVNQTHALIEAAIDLLSDVKDLRSLNRAAWLLQVAERLAAEMAAERRPQ